MNMRFRWTHKDSLCLIVDCGVFSVLIIASTGIKKTKSHLIYLKFAVAFDLLKWTNCDCELYMSEAEVWHLQGEEFKIIQITPLNL